MEEDDDTRQFRVRSLLRYLEVTDVARRWVSTLSNSYFIQIVTQRRLFCRHYFNNVFLQHVLTLFSRSVRYIPFPDRHDLALYARLAGKPIVMLQIFWLLSPHASARLPFG